MIRRHHGLWILLAAVAAVLSGCGVSGEDDLGQWTTQLRATTKPYVKPLTEPKQFIPEDYTVGSLMDPYDPLRLTKVLVDESNNSLIGHEKERRKEPLEAYPLDAITMVGSLNKAGTPTALVSVNKLLYQVRIGNYLGQNYGKIIGITETGLQLQELIQDSSGEYVNRVTTLDLQEAKAKEVKK